MSEFTGVIERITEKATDDTNYFILKLKEADTWFSCWNANLSDYKEGESVKLVYTEKIKGDKTYYNITSISKVPKLIDSTLKIPLKEERSSTDAGIWRDKLPKEIMKECFKDAKEILSSEFGDVGPEELTKVSLSLFIQRMK